MTRTTTTPDLNHVDVETVAALTAKVGQAPEVAETTWRATVAWDGGFRSAGSVRHFPPIQSDEPASLGGSDTAPNPVEQLLAAFGNCLAVGYAANATAAGIAIDALSIEVEGDLNLRTFLGLEPEGHAGFGEIRATVNIETDATPEQLELLNDQVTSTSPVGHTLARAIPVDVRLP